MGHGKLRKFADMAANPLVVEPDYYPGRPFEFPLKGNWATHFFGRLRDGKLPDTSVTTPLPLGEGQGEGLPLVLELGCGRGEYTVGLAQQCPDKNFIGVDIKGARMWTGAQNALKTGMTNVGFLRTHIEFLPEFFGTDEVSELWLTFSDPQMQKATKRLTSSYFLERYRRFMKDGGLIHLKTDSNFLFTYTEELLKANHIEPIVTTRDLYGPSPQPSPEGEGVVTETSLTGLCNARKIQTYYESMWMERGIDIKYLCFRLPHEGTLIEPDVEIPLDEYRSYGRDNNSSCETHK